MQSKEAKSLREGGLSRINGKSHVGRKISSAERKQSRAYSSLWRRMMKYSWMGAKRPRKRINNEKKKTDNRNTRLRRNNKIAAPENEVSV